MKAKTCALTAILALSLQGTALADAGSTAAGPGKLDKMLGSLANGCTDNLSARIDEAYIGGTYPVKLVRPDGGKRIAPHFGKARLVVHEEDGYYEIFVPVKNATLYGIPVSEINWYKGIDNGTNGVIVTFPVSLPNVKNALAKANVKFKRVESPVEGWIEPSLRKSKDNSSHTVLVCDSST